MLTTIKKAGAALGVSAATLGLMATSAFASTGFTNTGDHVRLNSSRTNTTIISVSNRNDAHIYQSAYTDINTGNNEVERNIWGGSIRTGSASVSNYFMANANYNSTNISL
jgi:hypothetical protein